MIESIFMFVKIESNQLVMFYHQQYGKDGYPANGKYISQVMEIRETLMRGISGTVLIFCVILFSRNYRSLIRPERHIQTLPDFTTKPPAGIPSRERSSVVMAIASDSLSALAGWYQNLNRNDRRPI